MHDIMDYLTDFWVAIYARFDEVRLTRYYLGRYVLRGRAADLPGDVPGVYVAELSEAAACARITGKICDSRYRWHCTSSCRSSSRVNILHP